MEKWKYKSLELFHKIREENYEKTKNMPLKKVIQKSVKDAEKLIKELNLTFYKPVRTK